MDKNIARLRRAAKTRKHLKVLGATRLVVYRTARHMYAQVINAEGQVLAAASTVEKDLSAQVKYTGNKDAASLVGKVVAERAIAKGVTALAFDRSGYKYHGRVAQLAEAARSAGLRF